MDFDKRRYLYFRIGHIYIIYLDCFSELGSHFSMISVNDNPFDNFIYVQSCRYADKYLLEEYSYVAQAVIEWIKTRKQIYELSTQYPLEMLRPDYQSMEYLNPFVIVTDPALIISATPVPPQMPATLLPLCMPRPEKHDRDDDVDDFCCKKMCPAMCE